MSRRRATRKKSSAEADPMMARIEAFNEAMGGGVLIVKQSKGYCLLRDDNGVPIARLRPTGKDDLVAVMRRSYRDTWEHIGDFGPMVMPLDKTLEYVAKEPMASSGGRLRGRG